MKKETPLQFYKKVCKELQTKGEIIFSDLKKWGWSLRIEKDYYSGRNYEPVIVLKINKDIHGSEFMIFRGYLFGLLLREMTQYHWGICRSNQISELFGNEFELHPKLITKEYK